MREQNGVQKLVVASSKTAQVSDVIIERHMENGWHRIARLWVIRIRVKNLVMVKFLILWCETGRVEAETIIFIFSFFEKKCIWSNIHSMSQFKNNSKSQNSCSWLWWYDIKHSCVIENIIWNCLGHHVIAGRLKFSSLYFDSEKSGVFSFYSYNVIKIVTIFFYTAYYLLRSYHFWAI